MKIKQLLLIALLAFSTLLKAQQPTTMGKDFWMAFLYATSNQDTKLHISAKNNCSVTITNDNTGYNQSYLLTGGSSESFSIPASEAYNNNNDGTISNKSIHIVATDSISVFASASGAATSDASFILPTPVLLNDYIVQTYVSATNANPSSSGNWHSEFLILATEDSTIIDVTPTTNTTNGWAANTTQTITLQRGQCFQIAAVAIGTSLSGTHVQARDCKKIAVFGGHECAYVPAGQGWYCDHLFEQIVPIAYWGKHFVCTLSAHHTGDEFLVTSSQDSCDIFKDGILVATINMGESYSFSLRNSNTVCYIETSKPCEVYGYMMSKNVAGPDGDPSMTYIAPIEQQLNDIIFTSYNTSLIHYHYVNIVTPTSNIGNIAFDGSFISSQFQPVPSNTAYSYARVTTTSGVHRLTSIGNSGFVAHAYGVGNNEGYGYAAGFAMGGEKPQLVIDHTIVDSNFITPQECQNHEFLFGITTDTTYDNITWDLGDTTIIHADSVLLSYANHGSFTVYAYVSHFEGTCHQRIDTLNATINILDWERDTTSITTCDSTLSWRGISLPHSGIYTDTTTATEGCDTIHTLIFTLNSSPTDTTMVNICASTYSWRNNTYSTSGTYTDIVEGENECDSNFTLILNLYPSYSFTLDTTILYGESYTWIDGNNYTESINTTYSLLSQFGCDSIYNLNLNFRMPESELWIPNVFTPDERTNKTFKINGIGIEKLEVVIYNRWGDFVYRWEGLDGYWDGTHNGNKCKSEAYVYKATYIDNKGTKQTKFGSVLLLR